MVLSAWITTAAREAQKRGIEPQQLWEKRGVKGSVKFAATPALRTAVEGLRDTKISAVSRRPRAGPRREFSHALGRP